MDHRLCADVLVSVNGEDFITVIHAVDRLMRNEGRAPGRF